MGLLNIVLIVLLVNALVVIAFMLKSINKFKANEITWDERRLVTSYRNGVRGVYWQVSDLEGRALELEAEEYKRQRAKELDVDEDDIDVDEGEAPQLYDRSKMFDGLEYMIRKHDANEGITWITIDFILDEYCKF